MSNNRTSKRNKRSIAATISAGLFSLALGSCDLFPVGPEPTATPKPEPTPIPTAYPQYSGPKVKIAFIEYGYNEPVESSQDIWIVDSDGTNLKKIYEKSYTNGSTGNNLLKASPDGKNLAFIDSSDVYNPKNCIIDLDGNLLVEFEGDTGIGKGFSWTPDSKSILDGVYYEGIYRDDLETKTRTRIYRSWPQTYDHNPEMSPNLEKIIFVHHQYEVSYAVRIIDSNGKNEEGVIGGREEVKDSPFSFSWINNEEVLIETNHPNKIMYYNTNDKECKEIIFTKRLFNFKLSPNKKTFAANSGESYYLINVENLCSGDTNQYQEIEKWGVWSPDSNYGIMAGDSNDLELFKAIDKQGNQYTIIKKEDFPEKGMIKTIVCVPTTE